MKSIVSTKIYVQLSGNKLSDHSEWKQRRSSDIPRTSFSNSCAKKDRENEGGEICESIGKIRDCGALETTGAEITLSSSRRRVTRI